MTPKKRIAECKANVANQKFSRVSWSPKEHLRIKKFPANDTLSKNLFEVQFSSSTPVHPTASHNLLLLLYSGLR